MPIATATRSRPRASSAGAYRVERSAPVLRGEEAPDALLSSTARMRERLAPPTVSADQLVAWVADWVGRGGTQLGKATKFEVRDGTY